MARLTCCVCGTTAPGKQWWNRDRGYGVCLSCGEEVEKKEGVAVAQDYYGVKGVHWAPEKSNDENKSEKV